MPSGVQSHVGTHRPPTIIETAATEKEARRVLKWQHDVARSVTSHQDSDAGSQTGSQYSSTTYHDEYPKPKSQAPSQSQYQSQAQSQAPSRGPPPRRYDSYPLPSEPHSQAPPGMRLVRRVTETTSSYNHRTRDEAQGMSSKAIIGTLLGAAAGAAVAYAMVQSEQPELTHAPMQRRNSVAGSGLAYPDYDTYGVHAPSVRVVERIEMEPARTYVSTRDMEPRYLPAYSVVRDSRPPLSGRSDMHRITDGGRDAGRLLNNDPSVVGSRARSRARSNSVSDAGTERMRPLTILPAPAGSHVSGSHVSRRSSEDGPLPAMAQTQVSGAPKSHVSVAKSHVSAAKSHHTSASAAKSHHTSASASTIKPATQVQYGSGPVQSAAPSKAGTHVSTTTIKVVPTASSSKAGSRADGGSRASAHKVPLPKSMVSGYEGTVVPEDSVSNIGSSRRSVSHRW